MLTINTVHRTYSYKIGHASFLVIILSLIITIQFPPALAGVNTVDQDGDGYYYDPPAGMPSDPDDQNPCIPNENTEACIASQDPIEAIEDVVEDVNSLINSDSFDINSSQTQALLSKLTTAANYIEADKINVAINNLNAFINQINAYINSGRILPEDGQSLISQVNNVISSL